MRLGEIQNNINRPWSDKESYVAAITKDPATGLGAVADSESDLIELYLNKFGKNFKLAIKKYDEDFEIFRGVPISDPMVLINPTKAIRRAANTSNYLNIIMSHSKYWHKYPRRDRSIICSTSDIRASGYGTTYAVLPMGNPIIGICPADDIWGTKFAGSDSFKIPYVNQELSAAFRAIVGKDLSEDPKTFFNQLQLLRPAQNKEIIDYLEHKFFKNGSKEHSSSSTVLDYLESILEPNKAGFQATSLQNYNIKSSSYDSREVWFSGPALLIDKEYMQIVIDWYWNNENQRNRWS